MRSRTTGVLFALAGSTLIGAPAMADAAGAPTAAPAATAAAKLPSGHTWRVTLLTGDVVRVATTAGRPPLVSVEPGPNRRSMIFRKDVRPDGTVRVVPSDVAPKVGTLYDPALFDVTALIQDGDDDAHRSDLPLIIQGDASVRSLVKGGHALTSIGATAVRRPKTQGAELTRDAVSAGVRHVWLDRRVHARSLDHNLTQIGAPAAWNAGATGKGVKVAVLDTGVDATHPDLKGRIAEQRNFSPSSDTVDRNGHGTHVAATIAGTGASANGERKGVAPDADLLIGKVLDDDGYGDESSVIAGMEWAAPHARVVNLSLGSWSADPAGDPVTLAVDRLTQEDDTLFVVAAGNDGPGADTIEAPGAAASALTVGAVDGDDHVADFSSRGGTLMKPEVTAPGVDIVAARAAGTSMGHIIDANYTSASGTSMATPHVTGAAADLLQRHPGWSAAQVKAALVTTADAVPGTLEQVGGGRLNAGAAATATVVGDQANTAFGSIPHGSTTTVTKRLSWTNTRSEAVTLKLAARLTGPGRHGSSALRVPATVTVPAGGSAEVTASLDPGRLTRGGRYEGAVTASAEGVSLRTPVSVYAEPETHTLTLKATPLPGASALSASAVVFDLDDPTRFDQTVSTDAEGNAQVEVPAGRYAVFGEVYGITDGWSAAFAGTPEVKVDRDVTVPLDGAHARPMRATVPGTELDQSAVTSLHLERGLPSGVWGMDLLAFDGGPQIYTTATTGARLGTFDAYAAFRLRGERTVYDLLHHLGDRVPAEVDYRPKRSELATVNERYNAVNGDTGSPSLETRYGVSPTGFLVNEAHGDVPAGSTRVDHVTGEPGIRWVDDVAPSLSEWPAWAIVPPTRRYPAGTTRTSDWMRQPFRPGPYSATGDTPSYCVPGASTRSRGNIHVELVDLQDLPDGFDCLTDMPDPDALTTHTMKLYAGDTPVGTVANSHGDFSVPATAGTYRLVYDVDASKSLPVSTRTSTTWTFHSDPVEERLPLLLVDYRLPLDLFNHPNGDTATFTVSRVAGAAPAKATGLKLWTSLDDGATWQAAHVTGTGGKYSAALPHAAKGQAVSLRVRATDSGGGAIDQTILRAYFGA
ncbi:S8 family serine peptidase [Actinoallomurus oryzae]|uniref:S8 family serine peptidase n=1 Tax=Actinoallomurus oryzae TaxID=502180 RepID=A0ABP8QVQ9_9ACTN